MSSIQPTPPNIPGPIPAPARVPDLGLDAPVREAIVAVNARFTAALRDGDTDAVAACYTTDAQLLPPNHEVVRGRAAIGRFWQSVLDLGVAGARLETLEVEPRGGLAVEVGRYEIAGADGATIDRGKYLVAWHEEGTEWRIHRDMWASDLPAAGAAPAGG